jgi:hypothetical protein
MAKVVFRQEAIGDLNDNQNYTFGMRTFKINIMKRKLSVDLGLILILFSLLFIRCNNDKNLSIEIVQKSKVQIAFKENSDNPLLRLLMLKFQKEMGELVGLSENSTWQDFANRIANEDSNTNYEWTSEKTADIDVYLVTFSDKIGWGHRWEVNVKTKIVKFINIDEYLSCKYKLSRHDKDTTFEVTYLKQNSISHQFKTKSHKKKELVYIIKGKIKNKSGRPLTQAKLMGNLKIIYKDKSIVGSSNCNFWDSKCGFKDIISERNPWKYNSELEFSIATEGIDDLYLNYPPEYAFFLLELETGDPIGFKYQKAVAEFDVKKQLASFKK